MTTVHIVLNAHLDPIWLWSWRDGLDEVLNTSRFVCDLLDRHPDIVFTRGEGWLYEQIAREDPALFRRIRRHVRAGRWSPVGGWYIQPDCNAPSGFAMERQIALGRRCFLEYFGKMPRVAYNVDSFGHAATLPALMRRAGQPYYVMMRPQEHERPLPARLFRWRGYAGGPEVTTFRIASAYCTPRPGTTERASLGEEHVRLALSELPEGVSHTMCFVGIGDHGGGPTEEMIAWIREHREAIPGARLEFSSPERFFAAIERERPRLPLVTGELQMHAVGCYTVHRPVKTLLRKAEHRLMQAEAALGPRVPPAAARDLDLAWRRVCFHAFHDTLGGTCLPSAYEDIHAELGQALAIADGLATSAVRRRVLSLPPDPSQRILLFNASGQPFRDYVEVEPHLDWTRWQPSWTLADEKLKEIPCQSLTPESGGPDEVRLLFPIESDPGKLRTVRIVQRSKRAKPLSRPVTAGPGSLQGDRGLALDFNGPRGMAFPGGPAFSLPELALYEDRSDTWSHGIDRYAHQERQAAAWEEPRVVDSGPLMASLFHRGKIGSSPVQAEWRVYRGMPWVECLLRVTWIEERRVLKLEWPVPGAILEREDGILGGSLKRQPDGREHPLRDWTRVRLKTGEGATSDAAIVCPDVFALDVEADRIRLTLLRSAVMACHDEKRDILPRSVFSDRGEHAFRLRFWVGRRLAAPALDAVALSLQRPLLTASLTRGMKTRALRGQFLPAVTLR